MDNAAKEWLDYAETDLGVARHLLETYRPPWWNGVKKPEK